MRALWISTGSFLLGFYLAWTLKPYSPPSPPLQANTQHAQHPKHANSIATEAKAASRLLDLEQEIEQALQEDLASATPSIEHPENTTNPKPETNIESNVESDSDRERFIRLLDQARYAEAIALYTEIENQTPGRAARFRKIVLDRLQSHLNLVSSTSDNQDHPFTELSEAWLHHDYADIDALLLLAEYNTKKNHLDEAAITFDLAYHYSDNARKNEIRNRFEKFVIEAGKRSHLQGNTYSEIEFYQVVLSLNIANSHDRLEFAKLNIKAQNYYLAKEQLNTLRDDPIVGNRARALLSELDNNPESINTQRNEAWRYALTLQPHGNHFIIDAQFSQAPPTKLLIDTGASMTTISQSAFERLHHHTQYRFIHSRLFNTAGGVVRGAVLEFEQLQLGPLILKNIRISVLNLPENTEFDGLLGMNVLHQFRFHIDQDSATLFLDPRKN